MFEAFAGLIRRLGTHERGRSPYIRGSASFEGMLLLEFGQGAAHVGFKLLCLRHQGRIGRGPFALQSHQFLVSQFLRHFQDLTG